MKAATKFPRSQYLPSFYFLLSSSVYQAQFQGSELARPAYLISLLLSLYYHLFKELDYLSCHYSFCDP